VGRPASAEPQADVAVDKARGLYELVAALWEQLGRACAEEAVALALRYAERRSAAFDPERCVVVHGDAAPPNCLQVLGSRPGAEAGYVFVDPDGFVGDPAYDLGVALRDWCPQLLAGDATLLAREYCRLLASGSGLDETPNLGVGLPGASLHRPLRTIARRGAPRVPSAAALRPYVGARAVSDPASSA